METITKITPTICTEDREEKTRWKVENFIILKAGILISGKNILFHQGGIFRRGPMPLTVLS